MKKSINPFNQITYDIPETLDDSDGIKDFLSNNSGKKVIVVQGLGFVGAVMSLVCANSEKEEYAVIGIDLPNENSFWKIKSINEGLFPLIAEDPKIDEFFNNSKKKNNFYATYDPLCFKYADVIIVDINLDVQKDSLENYELNNFEVDLSSFKKAITTVGEHVNENALMLVETTVPPGTCEQIIKPIMQEEFEKRNLSFQDFGIGHSYERVMPGPEYVDSIKSFPRVYSGINEESANRTEVFLRTIIDTSKCDLTRLEHTNATEMAKVLENSYRATNIAFAVEWSRFAEEAGVDMYEIVNAIRVRNTHSNLMYPGIGVGGYCLTKDPLLASWSRKNLFGAQSGLDMSVESVSINDRMPRYAHERLKNVFGDLKDKNILLLGVSYRGDVGDTRYTPVEPLFKLLKDGDSIIELHDPYITFWEEQNCKVETDFDLVIDNDFDMIIISTGHSFYAKKDTFSKILNLKSLQIYDTIGLFSKEQIEQLTKKHDFSVLGRGDI
jgi:UDP-N-acetyl-D-glucosamine dehydrogenase